MRSLLAALLVLGSLATSARAETFDITTYTPPAGWSAKREKNVVTYTTVDVPAKTFCRIQLYPSTQAGDARVDFATDWRELVQPSFKNIGKPTMGEVEEDKGWQVLAGMATTRFDGKPITVVQMVASKGGRRIPIQYSATGDCSAQLDTFTSSLSFVEAPQAAPTTTAAPISAAWSAVAKTDWVEVTSTAGKVLVHYPDPVTSKYDSVLANSVRTAWNTLVAPHYGSISNLEIKPIQSYNSVTFAEADAVEKGSNRNVHVVLFKLHDDRARNRYLEFVTSSKAAFEKSFGPYHKDEFHWEKLTALGNYDRFTVAPATLAGTWASSDSASVSYYYVSSGLAAGADATSIAQQFTFDGKGGYASDSASSSGAVGNAKFARVQYKGAYSVDSSGVKLTLTNRFKSQPETYTAYFQAVKGGNALVMIDAHDSVTYLGKQK